jgi:hypothetical protein
MAKWYEVKRIEKRIDFTSLENALEDAGFVVVHDEGGK